MENPLQQIDYRFCTHCNRREIVYRKVYYVRDHGSIHTVKSYNTFYICGNDKCVKYVPVTTGEKIRVYDEIMEWYRYDF